MKRALLTIPIMGLIFMSLFSCQKKEEEWIPLFNGKDLTGWTPKITGYEAGNNFGNTFRVQDGLLTVSYDQYDSFDNRFGHLFYEKPYSSYLLRVEYRFIGDQVPGGEGWALRNSGVMLHSQSVESMGLDQNFPISLEAQFLGGLGQGERRTGNLCTPGTNVVMNGELITAHCIDGAGPTIDGDAWVTMDLLVKGDDYIAHIVNGDTLISYSKPTIGGGSVNNFKPEAKTDGTALTKGYIVLQSESHPIQFRKVLLKDLSK